MTVHIANIKGSDYVYVSYFKYGTLHREYIGPMKVKMLDLDRMLEIMAVH